jgi:hypothetical protein
MSRVIWNVVLLIVVLTAVYTVWQMGNTSEPMVASSPPSSPKGTTATAPATTTANSTTVARAPTAPVITAKP